MKNLCVFCGSNAGADPIYTQAAQELGKLMAERDMTLVYGGGNVGLMGVIADECLNHGGKVIGVIPNFLQDKEVGHDGLTKMIVVKTMHERKQIMADLSDGFVAMPGGFGTMDELCEILTWSQLGLHSNPIGLLNINGYYDHLKILFDHMVDQRFLHPQNRATVLSHSKPEQLLRMMDQYEPPDVEKWLDRAQV
ncbi:MAG: TIGR00730 family Rossman fold protein [Bacteroidetes bacterium]|nr:TIGR00730 family Rossman fold protein [Bacteroidota bacterium]MCB0851629.1 TIGR00730 family Rossman fold protein [Bacteroidota bacterium]